MVSEAQYRAQRKYQKERQEQIAIRVKKGVRDIYKTAAEERGLSLAAFVVASMDEYIQHHPVKK